MLSWGDLGVILGGSCGALGGILEGLEDLGVMLGGSWGILEGGFFQEAFGRRVAVLSIGSEAGLHALLVVYGLSLRILSHHSCPLLSLRPSPWLSSRA